MLGEERPAQEGLLAVSTAETGLSGMPVLAVIGHLTLVDPWEKKRHEEADELLRVIT